MSAWACPHDANGVCQRVAGAICAPGMRGCVLEGRVRFADPAMNLPRKPVKKPSATPANDAPRAGKPPRRRLPF